MTQDGDKSRQLWVGSLYLFQLADAGALRYVAGIGQIFSTNTVGRLVSGYTTDLYLEMTTKAVSPPCLLVLLAELLLFFISSKVVGFVDLQKYEKIKKKVFTPNSEQSDNFNLTD
jgi:hypothetical protein